jgi:hypothetical protein
MKDQAIKVGVIAEQTGPLSFMGIANANVAKMVVNDINAAGGLLGRQLDLYVEDGATIDSVAEARPLRAPPSPRAASFTSTRSNTRARNATRSFSAPARCRHSRSIRSFPG